MSMDIRLKSGKWPAKKPEKRHIRILQLFRIVNALRMEHRIVALLHIKDLLPQGDVISSKIRFELFLKQSGFLHEGLKIIKRIVEEEKISSSSLNKIIEIVTKINNGPNKLGDLIKLVRNKLIFHLDKEVIEKTWASMNLDKETRIGFGKSNQKVDFFWQITEQMMLRYIGEKCNRAEDAKLFDELELEIFTLSNELADACNEYAVELLNQANTMTAQ